MKGTKRFGISDSNPDTNETAFRNKRVMAGSAFDAHRAEPSQQLAATTPLDMQRANSSWQHVRALNTQFASWVQVQMKNHPDELWEDGVRDYLTHASNIMEKFSDVVNWLKANAAKGGSLSRAEAQAAENKVVFETNNSGMKLSQEKTGFTPSGTTTSAATLWGSGVFSSSQTSGFSAVSTSSLSFGAFPKFEAPGSTPAGTTTTISNTLSSKVFSNSETPGSNPVDTPTTFSNLSSGVFSSSQAPGFTPASTTANFANSWSSGIFSNIQKPVLFGGSQSSVTVAQSSAPTNCDTSDDADGENELEQPSSPSVKRSEEKGIVVVHEVKCKLYVKSSDPADKDAWKDKGMGLLSIKCKEGVDKGTKESKPTIVVRNEVGRLLLNALLYPGIKTNLQKNSVVAIFHTSGDSDGNNGGSNNNVVARTFLIKTKTAEDRNKLATAIQEFAPAS